MGRVLKEYDKNKTYGQNKLFYIQLSYILASFLWLGIIFGFGLHPPNWFGWFIILLPLILFYIGFASAEELCPDVEEDMLKISHLDLGLVIVLALFAWMSKDYGGDKRSFVSLILIAIILSLIALFDVWVKRKWFSLVRHIKSEIQTISIGLLIYALYLYWYYRQGHELPDVL